MAETKHKDTKTKTFSRKIGGTWWEPKIKDKDKAQFYKYDSYKVQPRTIAAICKICLIQWKGNGYTELQGLSLESVEERRKKRLLL